jgi:phosphomannomutase
MTPLIISQALDEAIKFATTNRCTIILANDPDADRLAVAEFMYATLLSHHYNPAAHSPQA